MTQRKGRQARSSSFRRIRRFCCRSRRIRTRSYFSSEECSGGVDCSVAQKFDLPAGDFSAAQDSSRESKEIGSASHAAHHQFIAVRIPLAGPPRHIAWNGPAAAVGVSHYRAVGGELEAIGIRSFQLWLFIAGDVKCPVQSRGLAANAGRLATNNRAGRKSLLLMSRCSLQGNASCRQFG